MNSQVFVAVHALLCRFFAAFDKRDWEAMSGCLARNLRRLSVIGSRTPWTHDPRGVCNQPHDSGRQPEKAAQFFQPRRHGFSQ